MTTPRWRRYLRFWKRNLSADVDDELRGQRPARRRDTPLWFDTIRADVRLTTRSLMRRPAFSASVIITMALGLGVNAAMFSFLDRVYLRMPAGVADPGGLRRFWTVQHEKSGEVVAQPMSVSAATHASMAEAFRPIAATALFAVQPQIRLDEDPDESRVTIVRASAEYLPLLGIRPASGRLFTREEARLEGPAHVAVISDALWRARYGGESRAIGKSLLLQGRPFTIVGVLPPRFTGVDLERTDVWIPLGNQPVGLEGMGGVMWAAGSGPTFGLLARVPDAAADRALEARATTLLRRGQMGQRGADSLAMVVAGSILTARGPGKAMKEITIAARLGGVAVIVLLIAAANVVNLLLARAVAQRREIAVRVALGITRSRLIWLLAVPSVLLALVAGAVAAASAEVSGALLRSHLLPETHISDAPLHWRVALFTMLVAFVAGTLAGIPPAVQSSRPDLTSFLRVGTGDGVASRSRVRSILIVLQAALSVVLLVGSALFLRSLQQVSDIRLGYDVDRLMFATVTYDRYRAPDSVRFARAADRVRRVPGVEHVGMATIAPMRGLLGAPFYTDTDSATMTPGDPTKNPSLMNVSANYFTVTGMRIVRGRGFPTDGSLAVIVNETMARRYWPRGNAIGQCMYLPKRESPCYRVVGISEDAHRFRVIEEAFSHFYLPLERQPFKGMAGYTLIIRVDPERTGPITAAVRRAIVAEHPGARANVNLMSSQLAPAYRPFRMGAALFSAFGLLALVVAGVGVFSTVSYTVTQRTHEFGVRIALGANVREVIRSVLGPALRPVVVGVLIGIGIALAAGRLLESLLYGVSPTNPGIMVIVSAVLLTAAILASMLPAVRATRIDPVIALRAD